MKVLLVDDSEQSLALTSAFVEAMGHEALSAMSGAEALRMIASARPDIVLLDVMMPEMDGFETAARIRKLYPDRWLPLVFLTGSAENAAIARGIEVGGDDYLIKPVAFVMLKAKLDALARMLQMQRQLEQKSAELERYYQAAEEEQRVGAHLMNRMVHAHVLREPLLAHWIRPARNLSGDLVVAARTPEGVLHVLLADATGHGLAASLNVLPIVDPFYAMTAIGACLGAIASEMNAKIKRWLPVERCVAAALIAFDPLAGRVEVWSGGIPPAFLLGGDGRVVHQFANPHLPLGVLDPAEFDARTESLQLGEPAQLVVCSDGVIEAERADGTQFGRARLLQALRAAPAGERIWRLRDVLDRHFAGHAPGDDMAVALVDCRFQQARGDTGATAPAAAVGTGAWRVRVRLAAAELKLIDAGAWLLDLVGGFPGVAEHAAQILLVLSELFNNALDHGVLMLDSRAKQAPDGVERYLEMRRRRLARLAEASIDIDLEMTMEGERPVLAMRMRDSGRGFDYRALIGADAGANSLPHGRGIALVRDLCMRLEYKGNGNAVSAFYDLSRPAPRSSSSRRASPST